MERMYLLAYLQHTMVHCAMEWNLSKSTSSVSLSKLGVKEAYSAGHGKDVISLYPDWSGPSIRKEKPLSWLPPSSINSWRWGVIFLLTFIHSSGSTLPTSHGGVGWLDLFSLSSGICWSRWDYTIRLGDRGGTSTLKCMFYEINEKLVCANVPSILPL